MARSNSSTRLDRRSFLARTAATAGISVADGKWLFVNIQSPGISFAITGPWGSGGI